MIEEAAPVGKAMVELTRPLDSVTVAGPRAPVLVPNSEARALVAAG